MNSKKIKRYYFRLILRPLKTIRLSFVYFYGRIVLALALRGIKLPLFENIKSKMPKNAVDAFERQRLIFEIKGWRFSIRKGPFWYRKLIEKILSIFQKNRFWILILLKTSIAIFVISIPVGFFILLRAILPVPERVPYVQISKKLPQNSSLRVDWLYTEAPFTQSTDPLKAYFNTIDPNNSRGVSITKVLEKSAPPGLIHFGIGYYPTKLNLMRGFLVGETSPVAIPKQQKSADASEGTLRIQYYLFPSKNSDEDQCKIELTDHFGKNLATAVETTPQKYEEKSFNSGWKERLTPNAMPDMGQIKEFFIKVATPPDQILAKVTRVGNESTLQNKTTGAHDLTNDDCVFALGDLSFEHNTKTKLKRRGVVFILVDTLRVATAYDKELMPNLNAFAYENGVTFLEHRAQANMTVPSIIPLMTSRYSREIGPIAFAYAADNKTRKDFYANNYPFLATTMQNLGYRVGAIGWLSLFSEAMQGGLDLGFHNAIISENSEYEARQITEQMGTWLENYGDAPFFLYLHYNTMHGPYKPPFSDINLAKLAANPFGLNQRKQLYDGLGRYWDREFLNILQKLKDLGLENDVDVVITADHGAQFDEKQWNYFLGVDHEITGAYTDKGHSLFDEEIHVPLVLHLAHSPQTYGLQVSTPTAHVDLFPTLFSLAGGKQADVNWRGLDLSAGLQNENRKTFEEITKKRNSIYFDGHRYAGLLYWGEHLEHSPMKYIRQLEPDQVKLFLTHNPWQENIQWYQPELYSSVNLDNHTETWLASVPGNKLKELRQAYFSTSPSEKKVLITSKYTGPFSMNLRVQNESLHFSVPPNIKVTRFQGKNGITFVFLGTISTGEKIEIDMGTARIKNMDFGQDITPVICPDGVETKSHFLANILENEVCSYFAPPDGIIEENYNEKDRPVVIQKTLSNEQVEQLEGTGAGDILQNALREWGYAK